MYIDFALVTASGSESGAQCDYLILLSVDRSDSLYSQVHSRDYELWWALLPFKLVFAVSGLDIDRLSYVSYVVDWNV